MLQPATAARYSFLLFLRHDGQKPGQNHYAFNQWCVMAMFGSSYYSVLLSGEWKKVEFHEGKISVLTFGLFYLVGPSACSEIAY